MTGTGGAPPVPATESDLRRAMDAAEHLARLGDGTSLQQAILVLDAALEVCDGYLPGLLLRSRLHARAGDLVGAIKDAATAVTSAPEDADANGLLSEHMLAAGRSDEAAMFAYEALKAAPSDPARFVALAGILHGQGSFEAAEELFEVAGTLAPDDSSIVLARMDCLMRLNRGTDAVQCGQTALLRFKDNVRILRNLGNALRSAGRTDEAIATFEHVLHLAPDDGYARHLIATLKRSAPDIAEPDYVKAVFDGASAGYDDAMMGSLQSRIPGLVAQAVEQHVPGSGLDVLDAGCGTGLCGMMLRAKAVFLKGVDLSPGMVEVARRKTLYDALEVAEITASLAADPRRYDLVVAGDVMPYFGNIEPLLSAVRAHLKPTGHCLFSVELGAESGPFQLNSAGRFTHSRGEVRRVAAAGGFAILHMKEELLRLQGGQAVHGLIVVLKPLDA